jgi:hypothetical protein
MHNNPQMIENQNRSETTESGFVGRSKWILSEIAWFRHLDNLSGFGCDAGVMSATRPTTAIHGDYGGGWIQRP